MQSAKKAEVLHMSAKADLGPIEVITAAELARRLAVPESTVYRRTTARYPAEERIPCFRLGKFVRFRWNSPELNSWLKSLETR